MLRDPHHNRIMPFVTTNHQKTNYLQRPAPRSTEPPSAVDKLPTPTYYSPVMASERVHRRIKRLLHQIDEAEDQGPDAYSGDWNGGSLLVHEIEVDTGDLLAAVLLESIYRIVRGRTFARGIDRTLERIRHMNEQQAVTWIDLAH